MGDEQKCQPKEPELRPVIAAHMAGCFSVSVTTLRCVFRALLRTEHIYTNTITTRSFILLIIRITSIVYLQNLIQKKVEIIIGMRINYDEALSKQRKQGSLPFCREQFEKQLGSPLQLLQILSINHAATGRPGNAAFVEQSAHTKPRHRIPWDEIDSATKLVRETKVNYSRIYRI